MDLLEITKNIYITPYDQKNEIPTIGYVNGSKFSIMIDFGNSTATISSFENLIKNKNLKNPKLTILTHSNINTINSLQYLKSKTVSCLNTQKKIKEAINNIKLKSAEDNTNHYICPDISFSGKIVVPLGNLTCVIAEIPSPYRDDCVAVFIKEEKTLFLVDSYYNNCNNNFNLDKAEKLKKTLSILDFNKCILGNYDKILNKKELINFINNEIQKNINKSLI